jgi:hypothetical protein
MVLVLLAAAFLTAKLTVFFPAFLSMTELWSVELLLLSPEFQDQNVHPFSYQ